MWARPSERALAAEMDECERSRRAGGASVALREEERPSLAAGVSAPLLGVEGGDQVRDLFCVRGQGEVASAEQISASPLLCARRSDAGLAMAESGVEDALDQVGVAGVAPAAFLGEA
jgi:hypothetical protein